MYRLVSRVVILQQTLQALPLPMFLPESWWLQQIITSVHSIVMHSFVVY